MVTVKCNFLNIFIFIIFYVLIKSKNIEYKGLTVTVTNRNPLENKGFQGDFHGDFNRNCKRNRNQERIGESDE